MLSRLPALRYATPGALTRLLSSPLPGRPPPPPRPSLPPDVNSHPSPRTAGLRCTPPPTMGSWGWPRRWWGRGRTWRRQTRWGGAKVLAVQCSRPGRKLGVVGLSSEQRGGGNAGKSWLTHAPRRWPAVAGIGRLNGLHYAKGQEAIPRRHCPPLELPPTTISAGPCAPIPTGPYLTRPASHSAAAPCDTCPLQYGRTPLCAASAAGQQDVVQALLEAGASVGAADNVSGKRGRAERGCARGFWVRNVRGQGRGQAEVWRSHRSKGGVQGGRLGARAGSGRDWKRVDFRGKWSCQAARILSWSVSVRRGSNRVGVAGSCGQGLLQCC